METTAQTRQINQTTMKKRGILMKKLISMLFAILMLASLTTGLALNAGALTVVTNPTEKPIGAEGSDLSWTLDEDGTLTISGTGDMIKSNSSGNMPWSNSLDQIKSVVIEDGVTSVSGYAFNGCKNLKTIRLADSIRAFGYYCFGNCPSLESAVIPANCTTVLTGLFKNCPALHDLQSRSAEFPVENGALYNRDKTQILATCNAPTGSFVIPETVTNVYGGLTNLTNITELVLPDRLNFETSDLLGCTSLQAYRVSETNGRYKVVDGVLYNKSGTSVVAYPCGKEGPYLFPENVTSISKHAFACAQKLDEMTIPQQVTNIDSCAFQRMPALRKITILGEVKTLNSSTFSYDTALAEVHLPDGMLRLDSACFNSCSALTSLVVPDGVSAVEDRSFQDCKTLKELVFPSTLTRIGSLCFNHCYALERIHFLGAIPENIKYSYIGEAKNLVIHAQDWDVDNINGVPVENCSYTVQDDGTVLCSCGEVLNIHYSHIHSFGAWTLTENGYVRTCTECGETETMPAPVERTEPLVTGNANAQNYSVWSKTVRSYLTEKDGGMMRVEYADGTLVHEEYTVDGSFLGGQTLPMELPIFGGFYEGEDSYFLVYGQSNHDELNGVEVIRVVRYDKDWNRLGEASLYGANTYEPFVAGSLRMVQAGDMLYLNTCHLMYVYWGVNHQANMTLAVHIPTMEITDCNDLISSIKTGYVSHSFNQFILASGEDLLTLDQWEAGSDDRTNVLVRYRGSAGAETLETHPEHMKCYRYPGTGNATGTGLGGLEKLGDAFLIAGSAVALDSADVNGQRNIFVTLVQPKDGALDGATSEMVWLTACAENTKVSVPQTVKLVNGSVLILWTEDGVVRYTCLGEDGKQSFANRMLEDAAISDCKPVLIENEVVWYVTENDAPRFFQLNPETGTLNVSEIAHDWGEPVYEWADDNSTCTASRVCRNNPDHVAVETAETSYAVKIPPTETTPGVGVYTAEFENALFETQTKEIELPKLSVPSVSGELGGDVGAVTVSYTLANAPEGATLIAARYEGGRLTALIPVRNPTPIGSVTFPGSVGTYKLFLLDSQNRPLCEPWSS